MKQIFVTINQKFVDMSQKLDMNKIFKIVFTFKKLDQNTQRNKDKTHRKKKIDFWTALYIGYEFFSTVQCSLKLLFKNCII